MRHDPSSRDLPDDLRRRIDLGKRGWKDLDGAMKLARAFSQLDY
jgi:hypothetical protein